MKDSEDGPEGSPRNFDPIVNTGQNKSAEQTRKLDLDAVLVGVTMRVYKLLLVSKKSLTAREVQRILKLSSPSVAVFHLDKLERSGLISKLDDGSGSYKISTLYLKHYFRLRRFLIPRYLFHSVLATFLLSGWVILWAAIYLIPNGVLSISRSPILGIEVLITYGILGMSAVVVLFWFETFRVFKQDKI